MTKQELITYIDQNIKTNGNQEITAAVLNPVLSAIVEWANSDIGTLASLDTDSKELVGAINEINEKINTRNDILTGEANPNITPPSSYNLADYYNQTEKDGSTIALWQYNGIEWILIR